MDDDYIGLNKEEHKLLIETIDKFATQNHIYLYSNF